MAYTAVIDPRAMQDVQKAIEYYDEQQPGLGEEFENQLNEHLLLLEKNPFFQIRYDDIHCLPFETLPIYDPLYDSRGATGRYCPGCYQYL